MKKTKKIVLIIVILLLAVGICGGGYLYYRSALAKQSQLSPTRQSAKQETSGDTYYLPKYPKDAVPLYQESKIGSMKFFVNDDRGDLVNYYNVVYDTKSNKSEVMTYYKSLMQSFNETESSEDKIVGSVGKYKVTVASYEGSTVYLEVFLPQDESEKSNPYYQSYPNDLVTIADSWIEKESSYGKLNQSGGQIEYTRFFNIDKEKVDEKNRKDVWEYYYEEYKKMYADQANMVAKDEQKMLQWENLPYKVTLTFSSAHGRVYLMIRSKI